MNLTNHTIYRLSMEHAPCKDGETRKKIHTFVLLTFKKGYLCMQYLTDMEVFKIQLKLAKYRK
jgi:hypothetical protein